ncbi:unnamed protein product [Urochloa humidicola]
MPLNSSTLPKPHTFVHTSTRFNTLHNLEAIQAPGTDPMARQFSVAITSALLLAAVVVSMCYPGAGAARQLGIGREAAVAVAALATTGRHQQAQTEVAGTVQVPGDEAAGGDGSLAASKRLSPGGPDPEHH